jgi:hypothetical protein
VHGRCYALEGCHQHHGLTQGAVACRLQGFVYLLGDAFWLTAVSLQLVEALNIGYEDRLQQWEASGCYGSRPRRGACCCRESALRAHHMACKGPEL